MLDKCMQICCFDQSVFFQTFSTSNTTKHKQKPDRKFNLLQRISFQLIKSWAACQHDFPSCFLLCFAPPYWNSGIPMQSQLSPSDRILELLLLCSLPQNNDLACRVPPDQWETQILETLQSSLMQGQLHFSNMYRVLKHPLLPQINKIHAKKTELQSV